MDNRPCPVPGNPAGSQVERETAFRVETVLLHVPFGATSRFNCEGEDVTVHRSENGFQVIGTSIDFVGPSAAFDTARYLVNRAYGASTTERGLP